MEHSMEDLKEYHFVDDANDEEEAVPSEGFVIDKDFSQSQNLGAALLLSDKNLPVGFIQNEISYDTLASLSDKDLELLGISNRETRDKLMDDFKNLPNQVEHLEQYLARTNLEEYKTNILGNMAEHLENLKTSLSAAELKLIVGQCDDVLIGDTTYSSALVLKVLNEMTANASCIEKQLSNLKSGKLIFEENRIRSSPPPGSNSMEKLIVGFAVVSGMFGIGFLLYKLFKQPKLK